MSRNFGGSWLTRWYIIGRSRRNVIRTPGLTGVCGLAARLVFFVGHTRSPSVPISYGRLPMKRPHHRWGFRPGISSPDVRMPLFPVASDGVWLISYFFHIMSTSYHSTRCLLSAIAPPPQRHSLIIRRHEITLRSWNTNGRDCMVSGGGNGDMHFQLRCLRTLALGERTPSNP